MSANKKLRIDIFRIAVIHQQWAARANRSQKGALTTLPERHIFPSTTLSWERMDRVPNHIPQEVTMTSPSDIENFKASLLGELLRPGDPGYDDARKIWNGMIDKRPALIVHCAGVADVIHCVNFAQANSLLVAVRGGGHNVSGNAMCDGGLVIDLSRMKSVRVDPGHRTARAEPGVTWRELRQSSLARYCHGRRPVSYGQRLRERGFVLGPAGWRRQLRRCDFIRVSAPSGWSGVRWHSGLSHSESKNGSRALPRGHQYCSRRVGL